MIPHGQVKCKSEINKMKPVADGLEDQVNWQISYVNIDDQCDVYKSHHKHTYYLYVEQWCSWKHKPWMLD